MHAVMTMMIDNTVGMGPYAGVCMGLGDCFTALGIFKFVTAAAVLRMTSRG